MVGQGRACAPGPTGWHTPARGDGLRWGAEHSDSAIDMSLGLQDSICELAACSGAGTQFRPQRGSAGADRWVLQNVDCMADIMLEGLFEGALSDFLLGGIM